MCPFSPTLCGFSNYEKLQGFAEYSDINKKSNYRDGTVSCNFGGIWKFQIIAESIAGSLLPDRGQTGQKNLDKLQRL